MGDGQRCPVCNTSLQVISSTYESLAGSTDVYSVIKLGCLNNSEPRNNLDPCANYAGGQNPDPPHLITTIRNKVN